MNPPKTLQGENNKLLSWSVNIFIFPEQSDIKLYNQIFMCYNALEWATIAKDAQCAHLVGHTRADAKYKHVLVMEQVASLNILAVSYSKFIEPEIIRVLFGFSEYIWLETKIVFKRLIKSFEISS